MKTLKWGMSTARALLEYARNLSELYEVTGTSGPNLMFRALAGAGNVFRRSNNTGEFGMAFLAPVMVVMAHEPQIRKRLDEAASSCLDELPKLRASLQLALSLPDTWRPCFGPGGMAAFAAFGDEEGSDFVKVVREWLDEHPLEAQSITLPAAVLQRHDTVKSQDI